MEASRRSLDVRYRLLPFYYTLLWKASLEGDSILRALFFEFPEDQDGDIFKRDREFLIGESIKITPVLNQYYRSVEGYFPKSSRWYDWYSGVELLDGPYKLLQAPLEHIPVHIRGGYIIPCQKPALTTHLSRLQPYYLIVALDHQFKAKGDIFIDDGMTVVDKAVSTYSEMKAFMPNQNNLTISLRAKSFDYTSISSIGQINVLGLSHCFERGTAYMNKKSIKSSLESRQHTPEKHQFVFQEHLDEIVEIEENDQHQQKISLMKNDLLSRDSVCHYQFDGVTFDKDWTLQLY